MYIHTYILPVAPLIHPCTVVSIHTYIHTYIHINGYVCIRMSCATVCIYYMYTKCTYTHLHTLFTREPPPRGGGWTLWDRIWLQPPPAAASPNHRFPAVKKYISHRTHCRRFLLVYLCRGSGHAACAGIVMQCVLV